jgi:hypothetical protein
MSLTRTTPLRSVIQAVSALLRRHDIDAVLTGGACASLHARGDYLSQDLDYVLRGSVRRAQLDAAMTELGFARRGAQYVHARCPFFVEFPAGPLAIGDDTLVEPVTIRVGNVRVSALSATDSCRDRLAAFYHWHDLQSLRVAAAIARHQKVNMEIIRRWSTSEGHAEGFQAFVNEISGSRRT